MGGAYGLGQVHVYKQNLQLIEWNIMYSRQISVGKKMRIPLDQSMLSFKFWSNDQIRVIVVPSHGKYGTNIGLIHMSLHLRQRGPKNSLQYVSLLRSSYLYRGSIINDLLLLENVPHG